MSTLPPHFASFQVRACSPLPDPHGVSSQMAKVESKHISKSTSQNFTFSMRSDTMGGMKTFNLNIAGSSDIIIQVPDDVEIEREEAYAVALMQLQEKIVDGVYPINQRVWPCIFCDKRFTDQAELMGHVRGQDHLTKVSGIQRLAEKYMRKKQEEPNTYQFAPHSRRGRSSEYEKEYQKQYYIRKQLGEV
jgi:hypothetical protein